MIQLLEFYSLHLILFIIIIIIIIIIIMSEIRNYKVYLCRLVGCLFRVSWKIIAMG